MDESFAAITIFTILGLSIAHILMTPELYNYTPFIDKTPLFKIILGQMAIVIIMPLLLGYVWTIIKLFS